MKPEDFAPGDAWVPELDEIFTHIASGGAFTIRDLNDVPTEGACGVGVILHGHDGRDSNGIPLTTAQGVPMPSVGYGLLVIATMVVKQELIDRGQS